MARDWKWQGLSVRCDNRELPLAIAPAPPTAAARYTGGSTRPTVEVTIQRFLTEKRSLNDAQQRATARRQARAWWPAFALRLSG